MKKLLTLLAIAPMALTACTKESTPTPNANPALCQSSVALNAGTYEKEFVLDQEDANLKVKLTIVVDADSKATLTHELLEGTYHSKNYIKSSITSIAGELSSSFCASNWTVITGGTSSFISVANAVNELLSQAL